MRSERERDREGGSDLREGEEVKKKREKLFISI